MLDLNKISEARVAFDKFIDYIPIASTINCAVDLIQKKVFEHKSKHGDDLTNYQSYILQNKDVKKCWFYMLPFAKVIDKLRERLIREKALAIYEPGFHLVGTTSKLPGETNRAYMERATLIELNKQHPMENIKDFLEERMYHNPITYLQITQSNYQDWKSDKMFFIHAIGVFKEMHLAKIGTPGHEHDGEYFAAFVEAYENRIVTLTQQELAKEQPSHNWLLKQMKSSPIVYEELAKSTYKGWKSDPEFVQEAVQIFKDFYLKQIGTPGHEHDGEYFATFVEAKDQ